MKESSEFIEVQAPLPVGARYEYQEITKTIWSGNCLVAWLVELWDYRDLFYFLVWRDIKVRYKQTLLGGLPRIAVPVTPVLAGLIDFAIASLLLFVLMPYYGVPVTSALILWPILVLPLLFLTSGLGLIMASLSVRYRDVKYALPFLIQMMMFATPIIYPLAVVPASYRWLAICNPLTGIIEAFRAAVLHPKSFDFVSLGVSLVETLLILVFGLFYFRKTERVIADVI